jgi:hypothetical protein
VTPPTRTSEDVVANFDTGYLGTDGLYDTSYLVTEDGRNRMGPVSFEEEQVAMAEPGCHWPNQYLSALRSGDDNAFDLQR